MFIIWQLVSTSSIGHHQVTVQEHEFIHVLVQWPDVEIRCQVINICKESIVCDWKHRHTFEWYTNRDDSW